MVCWIVVQVHPETQEKHIALTTNPVEDINNLTIQSGGWEHAPVQKEKILVVASDEICRILGDSDLHSKVELTVSDADLDTPDQKWVSDLLKRHFKKEGGIPCL
jgi:hypothetical protein